MKSRAFQKSARRAVKSTLPRFISITLISFLGSSILAGLAAVSPNMQRVGDEYYDNQNVMDVRMLSTFGFTNEDVEAIKNTDGVSGVMASYTVDATGTVDVKDYTFRVNGLSTNHDAENADYINQLKLVEGNWPDNDNEAIIIKPSIGLKNISIGSIVFLNSASNAEIPDTIKQTEYTIVGIAESPYYMSFMQGNTSVGNGSIDYVLYVPSDNFIVDGYTDLYVTIDGAKEENAFKDEYFTTIDATVNRLKALANERETLRYDELYAELTDAKEEYAEKEKETNEKLTDANTLLEEGKNNLLEAKEQYANAQSEYSTKKAEVNDLLANAEKELWNASVQIREKEQELSDKKKELTDASSELEAARTKLDASWKEYNSNAKVLIDNKAVLAENKKSLDEAQAKYEAGVKNAENTTGMSMEQISKSLPSMKEEFDKKKEQYDMLSQLSELKEALDDVPMGTEEYTELNTKYQYALTSAGLTENEAEKLIGQLDILKSQLDSLRQQYDQLSSLVTAKEELERKQIEYNNANTQINDADKKLTAAKNQLELGEKEYSSKKAELTAAKEQLTLAENKIIAAKKSYQSSLSKYNEQKIKADSELAKASEELETANEKIGDGEKELVDKQKEYNDKTTEADTKLSEAKQEIEDAEEKLSDLGEPKWYVLDRDMNESFVTYKDDTERMHDLATVFPVIFFMVAALVCLTTMTRMVDEERTLIGTFKALGYSNAKIAGRYLKYASSASLIGSIAGVIVGFWLLPTIIWNAYGIVFALPEMVPAFYYGIALFSIFATVFIITLSTGIAVKKSLIEAPARLMQPKAPKSGKRVLLENVKPVWNRMTFTKKVTVRNLGLNKKRLIMSIIGIMGCTALVVTAFGAKNAVSTLLNKQFEGIFHYNVSVGFTDENPSQELISLLSDKSYFEESTKVLQTSAQASLTQEDEEAYNIYLVAANDAMNFTDFVTLTDPISKEELAFDKNSVIITQKLAMNLNIGVGDTIQLKYLDDSKYYPVTVTGITKNYAFNYVYFGSDAYKDVFGIEPIYNMFFTIAKDSHSTDVIKGYLASAPDIGVISFTDDLMGNIKTSINSVDNIIWILIIAAGLLAFVVLYNLTNINIGERQRELATLKVLGFYDKESYSYIFRETIILSMIGSLFGLFSGIFLYRAVIETVEPDMILLTRDLTWQGYLGAAILTMAFTWLVNQCMKPRIKNIDMLESLKSVE